MHGGFSTRTFTKVQNFGFWLVIGLMSAYVLTRDPARQKDKKRERDMERAPGAS